MPRWLHQAAAARPSLCLAVLPEGYTPRATTETVLHQCAAAVSAPPGV